MPRGGRRAGKTGKSYPNRSDLNTAAPSKTYGDRVAQERAMAQMPVAPPPSSAGAGSPPPPAGGGSLGPPPVSLPPINRPTDRPGEPLTRGLSSGPGAGPESLQSQQMFDPLDAELRALYLRFPNPELRSLLEESESWQ